ncbi:acetyltransferase, ribosomal protein N-acetylase [Desulfitobacterium dehalogenans ATCC 51507]|uniref:Acetyltransferase, ribosomal protein N-acetylase n=1 Tax=Desulfitobacterium dehalogenans (strain ATCC 51507 / DSM 9161 / JW/IU-DC1) TaxID=756499 RepID=I4A5T1_DESDJ|nr:GNAT family protein [Desulfitobacterium dehalogenans]AFL99315.1 acetyltransferase, ribosomal protein N-acetylase [Desulfitobacterium dehalogenans ATCC 51507]
MSIFLPIQSVRLTLREFREEDLNEMHHYLSDSEVLQFMMQDTNTEEGSNAYLKKFLQFQKDNPRFFVRFAIIEKLSNCLIGECGLNMPNIQHKEGELVYRLNKKYWGNGYATEAASEVVGLGFEKLGLHRIEAMCDSRNASSIKVLEKIGMIKEGCYREHRWIKGRWRDSVVYSILDSEYFIQK